jgi:peroxiredoxin
VPPLEPEDHVPDKINTPLQTVNGEPFTIADALKRGPIVLSIFDSPGKSSKAVLPMLQRVAERYQDTPLTVVGVSQYSLNITRSIVRRLGLTFPVLVEPEGYPISRAFAIEATPTTYLIGQDGKTRFSTVAFFKGPFQILTDNIAIEVGKEPGPIYDERDEETPGFVPGLPSRHLEQAPA